MNGETKTTLRVSLGTICVPQKPKNRNNPPSGPWHQSRAGREFLYSTDLYGSNTFHLFSVRGTGLEVSVAPQTLHISFISVSSFDLNFGVISCFAILQLCSCQVWWRALFRWPSTRPLWNSLPHKVHFQGTRGLHRGCFELGHMGDKRAATLRLNTPQTYKKPAGTSANYSFGSLSTSTPKFCLHGKAQLAVIVKICPMQSQGKGKGEQQSPKVCRAGEMWTSKENQKHLFSLDLEMHPQISVYSPSEPVTLFKWVQSPSVSLSPFNLMNLRTVSSHLVSP